jgi:predicted metal-dependent hydrolase
LTDYTIEYSRRKTIAIIVNPDLRVIVRAPRWVRKSDIQEFVNEKRRWIQAKLQHYRRNPPPAPRQFTHGEMHLYLGAQYRLRLDTALWKAVELAGKDLIVATTEPATPDHVETMMYGWYSERANELFPERLALCFERVGWADVEYPKLVLKRLKQRWGSCHVDGKVTLNTELIRGPVQCLDAVIFHELCHLKVPNHSPAFYQLFASILPDWRERKQLLDRTLS